MYEVYLERAAENDLKRLSTTTFHRIIPQIKILAENPRPSGCRKLTGSKNDWRIRVGDYRVLYPVRNVAPLLPPGQAPPRKGSCPGGRPSGPAAETGLDSRIIQQGLMPRSVSSRNDWNF